MAYNLSFTGAEIDALLAKVDSLPALPSADGVYLLQVSSGVYTWVAQTQETQTEET